MKNILPLFLLFILNTILLGQEEKVQIFLKNGSSEYFDLKEVKSWGLINNQGLGASFTVIDSIKTSNEYLADSIILQFEGGNYYKSKGEYIIDISNSKRKIFNKTEKPDFVPKSISVYYSINRIEQVVFKLEYTTGILNNLLYKIEGSLGFHSSKLFPFNQNFGFGLIYNFAFNNNEIGVGLSITNFNDYMKDSEQFKSLWVESLDISFGIPIFERKYFIRLDTNIYFEKLTVFDYNPISTVRLGLGINL